MMDAYTGMILSKIKSERGDPSKVFDWNCAAKLIKKHKDRIAYAYAGLAGDFSATSGVIWDKEEGIIRKHYAYLGSLWATPVLELVGKDGWQKRFDCYLMSNETNWHSGTSWPLSAQYILEGED